MDHSGKSLIPIGLRPPGRSISLIFSGLERRKYPKSKQHEDGLEPRVVQEVRELQIAVGMVAAEEGTCIVPESVRQSRTDDVRYLELLEDATSPIIMSHRAGDQGEDIAIMSAVIERAYREWGYAVPEAIVELSQGATIA